MYDPKFPPTFTDAEVIALLGYVVDELRDVAAVLQGVTQGQYLQVVYVAPTRPKEPQLAFADGTRWNPGSGKGMYVYYNGAWHFLG